MTIEISKVSELKEILSEQYGVYLHLHDACGAQSFSFDNAVGEDVRKYVTEYVGALGGTAAFFPKGDGFNIK